MTAPNMRLVDWLDDLCARFIINLPQEELKEVERICFQIEEAQWFYEDFIRPLDPSLPSLNLRRFSQLMFQHCPIFSAYADQLSIHAYDNFLAYKSRVPVRGAIMLNQEMTHAVLVKGWKKGAKWSFPRGKINKDELNLDCAVREVYEETGYDLKEAGLVGPDEQMKKIPVNMREQNMLLYVFRGVPMDTYFEPRTRKEISKIDWYRLTDLPTLKRKHQVQHGAGQDLIKENNFYMVAPFLGPLKGWIKQQHKLDKQKAKAGTQRAPLAASGITDTEEVEADTTADEGPIPDPQRTDESFHNLIARLQGTDRTGDAFPEVSAQPQAEQILDPASELKRLLSVGMGLPAQNPVEAPAPAQETQANPLVAMLQASSKASVSHQSQPQTPFEQILASPAQPHSPHGQHHPRPPHLDQMPPPPPFPPHQHHSMSFCGPHGQMIPPNNNGPPMSLPPQFPPQFMPPLPHHSHPAFSPNVPHAHPTFNQQVSNQAPRPYQRTGDPHFTNPQYPGDHGPSIPPASNLPIPAPPKLTAHALGLLNTFKMNEKPVASPPQVSSQPLHNSHTTTKAQAPAQHQPSFDSYTSSHGLPSANAHAPSPPPFQSPPPNANFQPAQPKPRNAHQNSLLHLFRSPSVPAATPSPRPVESPVELSAYPSTPAYVNSKPMSQKPAPPLPDMSVKPNLLDAFGLPSQKPGITSATVRGPVNAPDFDTMKKSAHLGGANGHSRGPSPAGSRGSGKNMFVPQQILRREDATHRKSPIDPSPRSTTPQTAMFKPQILRRPQQDASSGTVPNPANAHAQALLDAFKKPSSPAPPATPVSVPAHVPAPVAGSAQASFDRRETLPSDQKNALLSLFGKPAQSTVSPNIKSALPASPVPQSRSTQPPTPKNIMSGVISPVSPLPDRGSQQDSPADLASRSRISSIGDTMPPSIVIPHTIPTSHPTSALPSSIIGQKNGFGLGAEDGYASTGSTSLNELAASENGKARASTEGKSPVDKTFLLGFLEDVARRGR